jgi:protein-arginine kinase activator protein McsA
MCEKCGKNPMDIGCTPAVLMIAKDKVITRSIMLCESCFNKWRRVWINSGIVDLHGVKYENAYYDLFWKWMDKEVVQFS